MDAVQSTEPTSRETHLTPEVAHDLKHSAAVNDEEAVLENGEVVNASGHTQELQRQFSLWGAICLSVVMSDAWAVFGGTVVVSLYNGGPTGAIYEFLVAGVFYMVIAASLAELASAVPSSGGVYHWASVTPGRKLGRILGFFAGYWNLLAWTFGAASLAVVVGESIIQMYALTHATFEAQRWHIFITSLLVVWLAWCTILFLNRYLQHIVNGLAVIILGGWLASLIVCAVMPSTLDTGYASSDLVWKTFLNETGYSSNGLAFVLGLLNGAFCMSTADGTTHLAEEIQRPAYNIPKAMGAQMIVSYITVFLYMIVLFYGISDLDAIFADEGTFPLGLIYQQATGSTGGAIGLNLVVCLALFGAVIVSLLTASREFWTLARDNATPFARTFGHVNRRWENPFNAALFIGGVCTILLCIYMGSTTAFNAFVSSFVILLTFSYLAALLPFLLKRRSTLLPGPFFLKGVFGYVVNIVSCVYLVVMVVFYCFPFEMPATTENMNYSSLMIGGLTILFGCWWLYCQKRYVGPPIVMVSWVHS